ncbi:uncharacterized protein PHACADRAFT_257909 [Phanerochaete carnosa HHB-10118-sp]|uniref:Uncharacterized protein n=1 Tax=Phanerochaete carnosa (strain HHB-10118-sp) TaxID=650164 RepID=K5UVZ2_PHACS|nr:uncharacterized protein PHACADRAFT_257909 [Phanerochaete carnosa HHB-10118-sp]EKM54216.1 hypothetical protein PHACADRAFT_257909 [Phanerochaete carnosa HHB-10118-sp]
MIIAGYYRSKRNIRAAISVVTAMVDGEQWASYMQQMPLSLMQYPLVMMSPAIGLTNDDLRPAFIMLASCHTDLSRDSRRSGPEGAELAREHMEKAKKFFQVVYGTHFPSEESPRAASLASSRRLSLLQRVDRRPQDPMSPDDAVRIRTMEREIQSLRDKQTSYPGQLADARAAKRKVEEELDAERALRRKTEQETSAELLSARRSAKYALEQCKREVENRRRAEERTNELRDELATVQGELTGKLREAREKDRRARECFARLGSLFTKAAQGEVDDPTSPMFSSSSRSTRVTPVPPRPDSSSRPIRTTPSPSMGPPAKRVRTDNA